MTDTDDTPATESSRGRITRSAIVRSRSIGMESEVSPIIIISPRIDDCGPRAGAFTPGGSSCSTATSFSDTV